MLKKLFRILKRLFYLSNLVVAYFAYTGVISWLWLVACFVASLFFRYLTKSARYQPPAIQVETDGAPKVDLEAASEVVMEFGKVMLRTNYREKFYDENELPLTKEYILEAFLNLYRAASNDEERNRFKLGMMALSRFQGGVGDEPIEISLDPTMYAATEAEYTKNCMELEGC